MPKMIPIAEMRRWLELHEQGRPEALIAKDARRDVRTVKKGIEQALRERDGRFARAELAKDALRKHQAGLLSVLDGVLSALSMPSPHLEIPWRPKGSSTVIPLQAARAELATAEPGQVKVTLHVETDRHWELLREHLRRDSMWGALAQWRNQLGGHLEARIAMKRRTAALLREKTGYDVVDGAVEPPFVQSHPTVDILYQVSLHRVLGISDGTDPENGIVADAAGGEVRHGTSTLAKAPGAEEQCRESILAAFKELQASAEAENVALTFRKASEATDVASRAAAEIALLGLVSGQCRVCRRLGM